eukprot:Transcript_8337.p1 GENE.Transcript_8337~~Transcript_8337.p1  ORF type:complete len:628 (+),score=288.23 Transcript_8337:230-1885(+)
MPEPLLRMQHAKDEISMWTVAVPKQRELSGLVPYDKAMSVQELLEELVCVRLDQDFQLHKLEREDHPRAGAAKAAGSSALSLRDEQTYFLSHGLQIQRITFVQEAPRQVPRGALGESRWGHGRGAAGRDVGQPEQDLSFSEIKVTRQLRHTHAQAPSLGHGYHYQVCGPHMDGFQPAFSTIRPSSPHDFPWNRLDQIVCGWDCQLGTGLRLRCKRFAFLDYEAKQEDSLRKLLSAAPGTQRLLSASLLSEDRTQSSAEKDGAAHGSATEVRRRPRHAPVLSRDRFERFVEAMSGRVPLKGRVAWVDEGARRGGGGGSGGGGDHGGSGGGGGGSGAGGGGESESPPPQPRRGMHDSNAILIDMTPPVKEKDGEYGRRQFVQLLHDAQAGREQVWHLEVRWLICQGHRVEELIKHCARRAKQAGLLMLQIPTGRRPRPFSPSVLVPLPEALRERAIAALREDLGFVRESEANGERWMHELGVAFARLDPQGRGFLWSANRLQPSQAARNYSQHLLDKFRAFCDALEMTPRQPTPITSHDLHAAEEGGDASTFG